jgi:hypothetical protein
VSKRGDTEVSTNVKTTIANHGGRRKHTRGGFKSREEKYFITRNKDCNKTWHECTIDEPQNMIEADPQRTL